MLASLKELNWRNILVNYCFFLNFLDTKHFSHGCVVSHVNDSCMSQISFSLGCFFGQNMTFKSMFSLNLPGSSQSKSFLCTAHTNFNLFQNICNYKISLIDFRFNDFRFQIEKSNNGMILDSRIYSF